MAVVAAASVGVALTVGAVLLIMTLQSRLDDAATDAAELRARDVAALAQSGALPSTLALPGEESAFVQVVDESSGVIASTNNIEGEGAITTLRAVGTTPTIETVVVEPLSDLGSMRVASLRVPTSSGPVTVSAGESLRNARAAMHAITALLIAGVPLLTTLVAAMAWWTIGRTLKPVSDITSTMSEITASDLHRRVPVGSDDDEISGLASTVNNTLERLEGAVATQRRFVADASHELRGPLAALRADLEISVTHPTDTDWQSVAGDLLGDVERLDAITEDLLLLARLDSPPARHHSRVDLARLVDEVIADIRRTDVEVSVTVETRPCTIDGDTVQLSRMLRNLVRNAEQYAATRIAVDLSMSGPSVRLCVTDDGPGIPTERRREVFERFVRLDESRTPSVGGTGLGLAIVADVVAAHDGSVRVDDGPLGGASFVVELPLTNQGRRGRTVRREWASG